MRERAAPALVPLIEEAHRRILGGSPPAVPHVAFYPYASTKSTIRERDGRIHLRLSDHLEDAPDPVLRGVAELLLCRLRGITDARADPEALRAYHDHIASEKVGERRAASRAQRGRKHLDPVGAHHSLLESYLRVVLEMDLAVPEAPRLSWSKTRSRRRLGHHDADHNAIVISRLLDDPDVPQRVLDYVVYHELLHILIPPRQGSGGRRIVHSKEFRVAERRFSGWREADAALETLARGPRRVAAR